MCLSSNKFESKMIGFNLLGVNLLAAKHPEKNVVIDNNPWKQKEINYLVNEVKLQYLLHYRELNHWDQKFRETASNEESENWTVAMKI